MINFYEIVEEYAYEGSGTTYTPYAKKVDGEWQEGELSIDFLNTNFGEFDTATDMIAKSDSYSLEHLTLYFEWLVNQGKLEM